VQFYNIENVSCGEIVGIILECPDERSMPQPSYGMPLVKLYCSDKLYKKIDEYSIVLSENAEGVSYLLRLCLSVRARTRPLVGVRAVQRSLLNFIANIDLRPPRAAAKRS